MMMNLPPPDPRPYEALAELKIREEQRKRDLNTHPEDTSESNRLSRRAIVLIRLTVLLLIVVGVVILYRLIF